MKIKIYCAGGTIDKVYFDELNTYEVGEPQVQKILSEANVNFEYTIESLFNKDSLDMTEEDRHIIIQKIQDDDNEKIIITHGTDTMIETAMALQSIKNKTIVMTGAMQPARFKSSDAEFNIGCAISAVQTLRPGIYIVMNGCIYDPLHVKKNRERNRFEEINNT